MDLRIIDGIPAALNTTAVEGEWNFGADLTGFSAAAVASPCRPPKYFSNITGRTGLRRWHGRRRSD